MKIPFNSPTVFPDSFKVIQESLRSGNHSGRGPYTKKCENLLKELNPNIADVFLSTSCTHALEASAIMLNLSSNDEVIVPSYTFVTTALSFLLHGAKIRFCDIREDTLNIDEKLLESLINKNTKAIVVVHYAGVACEMDEIMRIANKNNLTVIEDNAHGVFGKYKGQNLGTFGDFAAHSFHETKNISCGEGGALFVKNKEHAERTKIIFEKGTNRSKFLSGQVDKYSWVDKGSSYILSDLLASLLYVQLTSFKKIQSRREKIWHSYNKNLSSWAKTCDIKTPIIPEYCEQTYHMFYLIMPTNELRERFIKFLQDSGITSTFHYLPLELSEMAKKMKINNEICKVSNYISSRIVRLPLFYDLKPNHQNKIIEKVLEFSI